MNKSRGRINRVRGKGRRGKVRGRRRGRGRGREKGTMENMEISGSRWSGSIGASSLSRRNRIGYDPISVRKNQLKGTQKKKQKGWIKLETDYKKLNLQLKMLGVEGDFDFCDLLGFNEELCAIVPQPVLAVVLVHPMNALLKDIKTQEDENPQVFKFDFDDIFPNDLFFLLQRIPNSCGTIALIHSILSQISQRDSPKVKLGLSEDGPLLNFFQKTKDLSPENRGLALKNPEFKGIKVVHEKIARLGLPKNRGRGRGRRRRRGRGRRKRKRMDQRPSVPKHFTCFVLHETSRMIVELDGTRNWPIQRGYSSRETFLVDVCRVIMEVYISKFPHNPYDFAALVLKKKE